MEPKLPSESPPKSYPFLPWVRRTCWRAMTWGIGALILLAALTWLFRTPGTAPLGRAFGALAFYSIVFWATLAKIWWTAGRPAVVVEGEGVAYQPLLGFALKRIPYERILAVGPKPGTRSLRIVHRSKKEVAREFFLNLAVIKGRNDFLATLGRELETAGLAPVPGQRNRWRRLDWLEEG